MFRDYLEVKLIVDDRLRKAEDHYRAAKVRRAERRSRLAELFGLRGPILQGA